MRTLFFCVFLATLLPQPAFPQQRTLFFINGLGNDQAVSEGYFEMLRTEYLKHLEEPIAFINSGFESDLLHNPSTNKAVDGWEGLAQLNGYRDGSDPIYDMLHRGEVEPGELLEEHWDWLADMTPDATAVVTIGMAQRIDEAARRGPTVVVGHSQGSIFAEIAANFISDEAKQNLTLIYLGTQLEQSDHDAEFIVLNCDLMAVTYPGPYVEGGQIISDLNCHGIHTYVLGALSYRTRALLFSAMDEAFGVEARVPEVNRVQFLTERPHDEGVFLEPVGEALCQENDQGDVIAPGISAIVPSGQPLYVEFWGGGMDLVPGAAWVHTCANMAVGIKIYEREGEGDGERIQARKNAGSVPFRLAFCEPQPEFSIGLAGFQVKDYPGGQEIPSLCRGTVEFSSE